MMRSMVVGRMGRSGAVALALLLAACSAEPTIPAPSTVPGSFGTVTPSMTVPSATTLSVGSTADLIFENANVISMDGTSPQAQAVAVRGSTILAVGSNEEIAAHRGPDTIVVSLEGRTITPGFIDTHEHRIGDGPTRLGLDSPEPIIDAAIAQGWTTIGELYVSEDRLTNLRELDEAGILRLRVNAYLPVQENSPEGALLGDYFDAYRPGQMLSPHVRVAGLKIFTDFDNATILLWSQDDLNAFMLKQYRKGWPLAVKTVSTRSLAMILTAFEAIDDAVPGVSEARGRLEHMLFATARQVADIRTLGLVPVVNLNVPSDLVGVSDIADLIAGEPEGSYAPWRNLFEAGIPAAGMSGFPSLYVDEPTGAPFGSPLHMIYQAVTRAGRLGQTTPEPLLDQAITALEALQAITVNAARATFEEDAKGSLSPGKLADLVVLSASPLEVPAKEINEIETLMTMIGGVVEFCAPGAESLCPSMAAPGSPRPTVAAGAGRTIATASRSLPDQPPSNAIDGDLESIWGAGAHPQQWIQIDLGGPGALSGVRLITAQYPAGETVHQVWVGDSETGLRLVQEFSGLTDDGQELVYAPATAEPNVRFVRIVTTESPSWVGWREIEVRTG